MIVPLQGRQPRLGRDVYVESTARVIGDVELGAEASVWFYAVVRADVESISIGARTNVQDHVTIHVTGGRFATRIGAGVTIGHRVVLHGCTVGDGALIGIGAIVLDGVEIGDEAMIGAGAVVAPGTKIPAKMLALGAPAKVVRPLRPEELEHLQRSAANYVAYAHAYRTQGL